MATERLNDSIDQPHTRFNIVQNTPDLDVALK